jgi:hypothetical protein
MNYGGPPTMNGAHLPPARPPAVNADGSWKDPHGMMRDRHGSLIAQTQAQPQAHKLPMPPIPHSDRATLRLVDAALPVDPTRLPDDA